MVHRSVLVGLVLLIAGFFGCDSRTAAPPAPASVTVFAAASTSDVIADAGRRFEKSGGVHVVTSFGASSTLAQQIKAGAKADIFLSADEKWMDDLAGAGTIEPGTRGDLLANDLVLIAPRGHGFEVKMTKEFAFASAFPGPKRLAVADPAHVPAGRYAQQSLEHLGWWDSTKDRLLPAQDVRAALRLVELGEADAGIVYSTDAKASEKVEIVGAFPADSHEPIRYPIAACKGAGPGAARFIEFLRSPEMKGVFEAHGFGAVSGP